MFTLYGIVKRSVTESVPGRASFRQETLLSEHFCFLAGLICSAFQSGTYFATQRSTCCCSHCAGTLSATLHFTVWYSVNIAHVCRNFKFKFCPVRRHLNFRWVAEIYKQCRNLVNKNSLFRHEGKVGKNLTWIFL